MGGYSCFGGMNCAAVLFEPGQVTLRSLLDGDGRPYDAGTTLCLVAYVARAILSLEERQDVGAVRFLEIVCVADGLQRIRAAWKQKPSRPGAVASDGPSIAECESFADAFPMANARR